MDALIKDFPDIQATIECGFTLKRVRNMIRTYSQIHHTYKYSEHSSIIWSLWPNDLVFVYKIIDYGFQSTCSPFNFRFRACYKQGISFHSGNYRVSIHSETHTWHDKNIQSNASTDKYSEHSSFIWPVCSKGWVFVYEWSDSGFESTSSKLNFRFSWFCGRTSLTFRQL